MAHSVALAERICQIQNSRNEQPHTTVCKLSDLKKEYCKRLAQQGVAEETQEINSTRLKEKLMAAVPGLTAHTQGREVLLAFNENIGHLISDVFCEDNDADADLKCLARAVRIVRKEMFIETNASNGTFSSNCQRESIPRTLLSLVNMILEGSDTKCQSLGESSQAALTLAQLLKFNSVKYARKTEECTRHVKSQETPLPVYIGVMLHVKTPKRELIDRLHTLGMSISYDNVLRLSSDMANAVCEHFKETDTVCPPNLKVNVFTTAAVDNIEHNTSSTTATSSFHDTNISLIQHPNAEGEAVENASIKLRNVSPAKTIAPLPSSYTNIPPLSSNKGGLEVPSTQSNRKSDDEAVSSATIRE